MPANVFTNDFQIAAEIKNRGCVNSARARKIALVFSQEGRKRQQSVNFNSDVCTIRIAAKFWRIASMLSLPQIPQLLEIVPKRCAELNFNFTSAARLTMTTFLRRGRNFRDLLTLADDCFGNKKTSGEFFIMTRRAHCRRQRLAPNANLERLFDREIVRLIFQFVRRLFGG